jgi:hypothetical protein
MSRQAIDFLTDDTRIVLSELAAMYDLFQSSQKSEVSEGVCMTILLRMDSIINGEGGPLEPMTDVELLEWIDRISRRPS